jgi:hypothetical protein
MEQRKELEETLFADDEMAVNPDDDLNLWILCVDLKGLIVRF